MDARRHPYLWRNNIHFMHDVNTVELQIRAAAITHCISLFIISIVLVNIDIYDCKDTKIKVKTNFSPIKLRSKSVQI